MINYICSKCKITVLVIENEIITPCKCQAPIVAEISAVAIGSGKLKK